MKLIKIELENLNSLYGNHSIDFEKDLFNAPLFLIMGATGAGKSTLMDAMCLALFGQTPRLTKSKSDRDPENDSRQIMSKGTAFAFSQLTFTKQENHEVVRYRATWQCERAYKKPDGNFKDPRRILERFSNELNDWEQLVSDQRPKFYEPHFNKVLEYLTVEDFKRMVLLAQGEFAAFLKANEEERAAILERLTNTEKYKEIGKRAAEKKKEIEDKLSQASLKFSGIEVLNQEQENLLVQSLAVKLKELEQTEYNISITNKNIEWIEKETILKNKYEEAQNNFNLYLKRNNENIEVLFKYTNYKKYSNIIELYYKLSHSQSELQNIVEQKVMNENEINILESHIKYVQLNLDKYKELYESIKREYELKKPLIYTAKELRIQRNLLQNNLNDYKQKITILVQEQQKYNSQLNFIDLRIKENTEHKENLHNQILNALKDYLLQYHSFNKNFEKIKSDFEVVKKELVLISIPFEKPQDKIKNLQIQKDNLNAQKSNFTKISFYLEEFQNIEKNLVSLNTKNNEVSIFLINENEKYLIDKNIFEKDSQEINEIKNQISKLTWHLGIAEKRQLLISGEECPLCGSTSHPYFSERSFKNADLDVLNQHDFLLSQLSQKELSFQSSRNLLSSGEVSISLITQDLKNIKNEIDRLNEEKIKKISQLCLLLNLENINKERINSAFFYQYLSEYESKNENELLTVQKNFNIISEKMDSYNNLKDRYLEMKETNNKFLNNIKDLSDLLKYFNEEFDVEKIKENLSFIDGKVLVVQIKEQNYFAEFRQVEMSLTDLNHKKIAIEKDILLKEKLAAEIKQKLKDLDNKITQSTNEINNLFNGEDPELIESQFSKKLTDKYTAFMEEKNILNEKEVKYNTLIEIVENLIKQEKQFSDALFIFSNTLKEDMKKYNLSTKDEFLKYEITAEEKIQYENIFNELELLKATTTAIKQQRLIDIEQHQLLKQDTYAFDLQELTTQKNKLLTELESINLQKVNIQAKIDKNTENKEIAQQYFNDFSKIKNEYAIWQKLHQLIGVNNGEQFKKFAQILNLEELICKANFHLSRFEKRYTLAPALDVDNKPRLAFAIRDSYHANELRSFKTLSGGETFLVSLALALALADYRTVKMPIETILLDEGFGTLDPSTLQVAMSALESLYSTGTQVGIISHVELLKDAIGARVIVEKLGNGHSCIKVENC